MYSASVYPESQNGATGIAFEAGAAGRNLTEWQHGLASISPRWNVSGTYMQVLPRFVSTAEDGKDEREFLVDYFDDPAQMLSLVFLKGYQWPFDARKLGTKDNPGSSLIDIIVSLEIRKSRRVFLDYTRNPLCSSEIDYAALSDECREYLSTAGACFGTPIDRLTHMNKPAFDFYLDKGVDLRSQRLEIATCVQHNNGGLAVDSWWRSNIEGLFPVGEAAGTHGVYRPGGSALNSGQAGSLRAALYIAGKRTNVPDSRVLLEEKLEEALSEIKAIKTSKGEGNILSLVIAAKKRMDLAGGMFRDEKCISLALEEIQKLLENLTETILMADSDDLSLFFRLKDLLNCQYVYLSAMKDYIAHGGKSRGSALYYCENGTKPHPDLPDECSITLDKGELAGVIQEILYHNGKCTASWRAAHEIPSPDDFFENVWRSYCEHGNVDS
jgi:succinate dehydrogenase/fumarate reductase flavoprotein subunit